MSTTRTPRRSSRSSVFGTLFGSGERYEVHSGCFGQYGSAWRCPEGCTLEINSEKLVLHFPQLTSEPPTSLAILISSVTAQDLSIEPLAARSDQPRLRLCLELAATPSCAEAATAKQLQRAMSGGPSLCVLQLGLAAAGPLVDGLRLADGPAHQPNREAPPVWLQWLPRRVYVQRHTRRVALWLYSLFFVVQLLWAVWSLVHNVAAVNALVDSLAARLDLLLTFVAPRLWANVCRTGLTAQTRADFVRDHSPHATALQCIQAGLPLTRLSLALDRSWPSRRHSSRPPTRRSSTSRRASTLYGALSICCCCRSQTRSALRYSYPQPSPQP